MEGAGEVVEMNCRCGRTTGCEYCNPAYLYPQITLNRAFEESRQRLLKYIDGYLYCESGQFDEIDELLDEFRQKMVEVKRR